MKPSNDDEIILKCDFRGKFKLTVPLVYLTFDTCNFFIVILLTFCRRKIRLTESSASV